ncbi:MAG TPA: pyrroloquinoline quinone biosynthesis peptide chaperone PqqD [Micropepsaceae bacterium]|nr:pyrroloquinoline quinone biosynthesis peptide chaperone PqqD [Micropepsaceae bacterium]
MTGFALSPDHRPRLKRGVKLARDAARNTDILNAPERIVVLDEIAAEILKSCDGNNSIAMIAASLAAAHAEDEAVVCADVMELLSDLVAQGFVE